MVLKNYCYLYSYELKGKKNQEAIKFLGEKQVEKLEELWQQILWKYEHNYFLHNIFFTENSYNFNLFPEIWHCLYVK